MPTTKGPSAARPRYRTATRRTAPPIVRIALGEGRPRRDTGNGSRDTFGAGGRLTGGAAAASECAAAGSGGGPSADRFGSTGTGSSIVPADYQTWNRHQA